MESMPAMNQKGKIKRNSGTPPNMLMPPKGDALLLVINTQ